MNVFPVGHYSGVRPGQEPLHVVRVGWNQHRLSEDAFGVWVLAHGRPEAGKGPWTVADLTEPAEQAGIANVRAQLDGLVELGLVALVPDEAREAVGFAQRHRMEVLFVGLGNTPEEPDRYQVGLPGLGAAAALDPDCYELWQWGSVAPTLWHSCEVRATVTAELGQTLGPVDALAEVLGDLRYLVAHGCAYLDVVG